MHDASVIRSVLKIGLNDNKYFAELLTLPIAIFKEYEALVIWSRRHYQQFGTLLTVNVLNPIAKSNEFVTYLLHQFREINAAQVTPDDFPALLALLKGEWSRDRLIAEVSTAIKALEVKDNPILIAERLSTNIQLALSAAQEEFKRHQIKGDALQSVKDYEEEMAEPRNLIKFGYPTLDRVAGGMKKGDLVLIIGPTGGGKSTLLVNFACNIFRNGYKVLFVSLEIPLRRMRARCHANLLGMDYNQLVRYETGTKIYEQQVQQLFSDIYGEITILDLPLSTTAAQLSNMITKEEPDILIVDYIGLMHSSRGSKSTDWEEQMDIANELKMLARRHEIIVMTAAQFNRAGNERTGNDLRLGDISRSFGITNPAAFVFGIRKDADRMLLRILKSNDSEEASIVLRANFSKMMLAEDTTFQCNSGNMAAFADDGGING